MAKVVEPDYVAELRNLKRDLEQTAGQLERLAKRVKELNKKQS